MIVLETILLTLLVLFIIIWVYFLINCVISFYIYKIFEIDELITFLLITLVIHLITILGLIM